MQTVTELPAFIKSSSKFLDGEEIGKFIDFIAHNPNAGAVMPRCGGLRKVRWSRQGTGKSGGVRVIYYFHDESRPIILVYAFAKAKSESLTREQEKIFASLVAQIKASWSNG